jgi:hypothetical protein
LKPSRNPDFFVVRALPTSSTFGLIHSHAAAR